MAFLRRRTPGRYPADREVVVERDRRPGPMTAFTSAIGWLVLLAVVAVLVIVFVL
jgi:hypothetical protein